MLAATRFLSLSATERKLALEAALYLLVVRLVFGVLPFARALRLLAVSPAEAGGGRVAVEEAGAVGRAIARAARHVPFRAACLQQAFAALLMLRRRDLAATVYLGLARDAPGRGLEAHAWSRNGEVPVTGAAAARRFATVATFAA
jgi:hypothetical protein